MLSNFNWQQFGLFTLIALLIYYFLVLLLYYQNELFGLMKRFRKVIPGMDSRGADHQDDYLEIPDADLVGVAKQEEGIAALSLSELQLGGREALQESLTFCMEEIEFVFDHVKGNGLDKKALFEFLSSITEHFDGLLKSEFAGTIFLHIQDQAKEKLFFELTEKELGDLFFPKQSNLQHLVAGSAIMLAFITQLSAFAQDGNAGINEATGKVVGYFDSGTSLMYAIGAIVGLVGAVKVYGKWNAGEPDTSKVATAWFGSCIFLVVVATVLKSFFGV